MLAPPNPDLDFWCPCFWDAFGGHEITQFLRGCHRNLDRSAAERIGNIMHLAEPCLSFKAPFDHRLSRRPLFLSRLILVIVIQGPNDYQRGLERSILVGLE